MPSRPNFILFFLFRLVPLIPWLRKTEPQNKKKARNKKEEPLSAVCNHRLNKKRLSKKTALFKLPPALAGGKFVDLCGALAELVQSNFLAALAKSLLIATPRTFSEFG
jgi:hypothetical protein